MTWPFRRKRTPEPEPKHFGPTSVDWVPGDIAECIHGGEWYGKTGPISGPALGSQAMVIEVFYGRASAGARGTTFALRLIGMSPDLGWPCDNFRKVVLRDTGADRVVGKRAPVRPKVGA